QPAPPGQGLSPRALDAHGIRLTRIANLRWPCTTKANGDRDQHGTVVRRSTFWVRKSSLFARFWTAYTILGIGDLADRQLSLQQLVATVRRALDAGLNLIDTAPGYEDGYSEQIVGQALKGCRDGVFVIDKIDSLDQPVAPQIEASLTRLQMDYTDLFVFHNLS